MDRFALFIVIPVIGLACVVLSINARRITNQALAVISLHAIIWILTIHFFGPTSYNTFWVRANGIVSSFAPWTLALLVFSIGRTPTEHIAILAKTSPYFFVCACLTVFCFDPGYVTQKELLIIRGPIYTLHNGLLAFTYVFVIIHGIHELRRQKGIYLYELQFILLLFGLGGLICTILLGLGNNFGIRVLKHAALLVVFAMFALAALATTLHRIFGFRDMIVSAVQRCIGVMFMCIGVFGSLPIARQFISPPYDLFSCIIVCSFIALWIDRRAGQLLRLADDQLFDQIRCDLISLSRSETDANNLLTWFENILCTHLNCSRALVFVDRDDLYIADGITIPKSNAVFAAICRLHWATPEAIERRRLASDLMAVRSFFVQHSLGLLIAIPRGSPSPSIIIALGPKADGSAYTYPEIQSMQAVGELIDNILDNSRLIAHRALQAKTDHLAMLSRGLAHDIKNLITPISSFLTHTDGQYAVDTPEAEVHIAARRSVQVMTDYVREALFFSEHLELKVERVNVDNVFRAVLEITRARSASRGITIVSIVDLHAAINADRVLLQRMLANLVGNAIDASVAEQNVELRACHLDVDTARFEVTDQGAGIAPENLDRIFEPYFTTKQFGDDVRGFGLGLTICQKIVNLHAGKIRVRSEVGKGTTVTVDLPLAPPQHLLPAGPCLALP